MTKLTHAAHAAPVHKHKPEPEPDVPTEVEAEAQAEAAAEVEVEAEAQAETLEERADRADGTPAQTTDLVSAWANDPLQMAHDIDSYANLSHGLTPDVELLRKIAAHIRAAHELRVQQ